MIDVEDYEGIPYKHRGRTRNGADCWGLIRIVYAEEYGIDLKDASYDEDFWETDNPLLENSLYEADKGFFLEDDQDDWIEGDILLFSVLSPGDVINHAGIWIPNGKRVLHCQDGSQSLCEPLNRRLYKCFRGSYRHVSRT